MPSRKKVAVFATEPVTGKIGGLGIRQLEVARELSRHFDVRLLTPFRVDTHSEPFPIQQIVYEKTSTLTPHVKWADVVYGIALSLIPVTRQFNKPHAVDLLVPEYFENLEGMPIDIFHAQEKCERFGNTISRTAKLLTSADFILVPTERIRDYTMGQMNLLGRLRPDDYKQDPQFRNLIDVAPFGLPSKEPKSGKHLFKGKIPGIAKDDFVILWGGSLANWFDAITPVKAIAHLKKRLPKVKLVFTGSKHPVWGKLPDAYNEVVKLAKQKRIFDKNVFIYTDWVPYEEHDYYLTESDLGISTFHDHVENHFSFRIRALDYLWGNLPIVTNPGNTQSEMIEREGLGTVLPFGDDKALAKEIEYLATHPEATDKMRSNIQAIKPQFHWSRVLEPLVRFCHNPVRSTSLFSDNGVPEDRKQTSSTFVFDPDRFAETHPENPFVQLTLSKQGLNENDKTRAASHLKAHLDLFGYGLESHLFLNPLFGLSSEFSFEEILELVPDHPHAKLLQAGQALNSGYLDSAQAMVEEIDSLSGKTAESHFVQGLIYQKRDCPKDAIMEFENAVKDMPGYLPLLLPLADSLISAGDINRARKLYQKVWRESMQGAHSSEEWLRTHSALAIARLDADMRPELDTLNRYFKKDRTNETLAHVIASMLELEGQKLTQNGNSEKARSFYQKAWRLDGKTAGEGWIRVVAAMNLARLNNGSSTEVETLKRFLEKDPENERLAYAVASTLERQGRSDDARKLFEGFTQSFKDKSILGSVWYRLALLSPKKQQKRMIRHCLDLQPAHREARELLRSL